MTAEEDHPVLIVEQVPVNDRDIRVARLLLEMADHWMMVPRNQLRDTWRNEANTIAGRSSTARGKGSMASKLLKDALNRWRQLGAIDWVGLAGQEQVRILDADFLRRCLAQWKALHGNVPTAPRPNSTRR